MSEPTKGRVFSDVADEAAMARVIAESQRVRAHYADAPARFLAAWKEAVKLAGPRFFECDAESVDAATDKWQLKPKWEEVDAFMGVGSTGERVFLAAVVSFYNNEWGQGHLEAAGWPNLAAVANRLDLRELEILTQLMLNYTGW